MNERMYKQRVRSILSGTPVRAREVLLAVSRCGEVATRADVLDAWRALAPAGTGGREFRELDAEARVLVAAGLLTTSPPPWRLTDAGRGIVEYLDERAARADRAVPELAPDRRDAPPPEGPLHDRSSSRLEVTLPRIRDAIVAHLAHGESSIKELCAAVGAGEGSVSGQLARLLKVRAIVRVARGRYALPAGRAPAPAPEVDPVEDELEVADPPDVEGLEPVDPEATPEDLVDLLALVGAELPVDPLPRSVQRAVGMWSDEVRLEADAWAARWRVRVASWTEEQRREVDAWASALHLAASDHDDVEVPRTPAVLAQGKGLVAEPQADGELDELRRRAEQALHVCTSGLTTADVLRRVIRELEEVRAVCILAGVSERTRPHGTGVAATVGMVRVLVERTTGVHGRDLAGRELACWVLDLPRHHAEVRALIERILPPEAVPRESAEPAEMAYCAYQRAGAMRAGWSGPPRPTWAELVEQAAQDPAAADLVDQWRAVARLWGPPWTAM